jgi:hypothetical protein
MNSKHCSVGTRAGDKNEIARFGVSLIRKLLLAPFVEAVADLSVSFGPERLTLEGQHHR